MPQGASILCCTQAQHGQICLWALVEPERPTHATQIRIYSAGHDEIEPEVAFDYKYVGTVQLYDSQLVFHVFAGPTSPQPPTIAGGRS